MIFPTNHTILIFTARKQSLGQGNIFIGVCQEFCSQGGVSASVHAGIPPGSRNPLEQTPPRAATPRTGPGTPPGADTPHGSRHPGADTPQTRHPPDQTPSQSRYPQTRYPPRADPPRTKHPPTPAQRMLGDTVNAQAVRILLECNLVNHPIIIRNTNTCHKTKIEIPQKG